MPTTYYVWRRVSPSRPHIHGIVGISVYDPNKLGCPDWESYEILLVSDDFDEAQGLTVKLQSEDPRQSGD